MAYPVRSQFGAEEGEVARAAAKFDISCPQCRMKFENHRLLERHRASFCARGQVMEYLPTMRYLVLTEIVPQKGAPREHVSSVTSEGQADHSTIGHLTLAQLKQAFKPSSLSDLQQRSLQAEQLALAAQVCCAVCRGKGNSKPGTDMAYGGTSSAPTSFLPLRRSKQRALLEALSWSGRRRKTRQR
eukprot:3200607-Rhodomonas_salina.1